MASSLPDIVNWKLGLLALAVCGATALVVGLAIGGHGQTTKMSTEVVRITRTTTTAAPVEPTETTPSPPAAKTSGHPGASAAKRSKSTPSARRTSRAKLPLEGTTISVDPGHNGGNFTHPEEIYRLVPARCGCRSRSARPQLRDPTLMTGLATAEIISSYLPK